MLDRGSFSESQKIQLSKTQQTSAQHNAIAQDLECPDFKESLEVAFNPIAMRNRFERLEQRVKRAGKEEETSKAEKGDELDFSIEAIQEVSQQFEQKNPELEAKALLSLRSRILKTDSFETILRKIQETYPDLSLADEALDFLIATADKDLAEKLLQVKTHLNQTYPREIKAGKNIMSQAQAFSAQNLGTPTDLRDLYRDITGNPRDPATLFAELALQYTFEKMKTVVSFVLHSLGQDLKSKGPSIEPGELQRLFSEARSMQAILGVYRFFQSRMLLIQNTFQMQDLYLPARISFENLARMFVKFLLERYPSPDKVLQMGAELGLSEEVVAEIIIFSQMKDAIRQVSPRLYRSQQHKQDVLASFLETLEELEDDLDQEEEEEENKEKRQGKEDE